MGRYGKIVADPSGYCKIESSARGQEAGEKPSHAGAHEIYALGMEESWRQRYHAVGCCTYLFFGCLRAGEVLAPEGVDFHPKAHLSFDNVLVDSLERPQVIRVRIKEPKMDRIRKGATVILCWTGGLGENSPAHICPTN